MLALGIICLESALMLALHHKMQCAKLNRSIDKQSPLCTFALQEGASSKGGAQAHGLWGMIWGILGTVGGSFEVHGAEAPQRSTCE